MERQNQGKSNKIRTETEYSQQKFKDFSLRFTFTLYYNSPGYFAGIAITIFIFTSMVFICYDCLVERRQRKVYSSAVKNNAIVSQLFPKNGKLKKTDLLFAFHFDHDTRLTRTCFALHFSERSPLQGKLDTPKEINATNKGSPQVHDA